MIIFYLSFLFFESSLKTFHALFSPDLFCVIKELLPEDPPVYMLHEADALADWKLIAHTLSEYLMWLLWNALTGIEYTTAQDVSEEKGLEFYEEEYANKMIHQL